MTTCFFFSQKTSIQFEKHRPVSLRVVSQTPLLSAYPARANSLKTHGFLSSTYLTLHPAERRDVMSAISVAQACRVTELAFLGFLFLLLRNVMSAISVAQARRVAELAFMGFLFFLLRNVMNAISVAQACRVAELAFHDIFKGGDHSSSES